jgi:hypothetical protein
MLYLLVDPVGVGGGVLSGGGGVVNLAAQSWDSHWTTFFEGGLFTAVNHAMLGIALIFFVYSSVMTLIEWINTGDDSNWNRMIAPLIVVAFLVNDGGLTKTMILGVRAASNAVSADIITTLKISQYYNDKLKNVISTQQAVGEIKSKITTCQSMADPTARDKCLGQLEQLLQAKRNSGEIRDKNLLDKIGETITIIDNPAGVTGGILSIAGGLTATAGKIVLAPFLAAVFLFLMAVTSAVQNMVEGSMLLTSLLAPVYITAALLPDGKQSIIALCQSYWTIINYKLCYIIILGLTSQLLVDDDGIQGLVLVLISAIFAPILAGILAAGGGMGFANAAAGAATQALSFAGNIGMNAMTGGVGGTIASTIGSKLGGKN